MAGAPRSAGAPADRRGRLPRPAARLGDAAADALAGRPAARRRRPGRRRARRRVADRPAARPRRGASRAAVERDGSHCSPRLPASIASLASRSACLFFSRGIHSYVTWPGGKIRAASAASGFMSGCLIFQRPDICSTTSLESIRTRTPALRGRGPARPCSPAIRPRYSATLFVATPMYSAASASVSPVAASSTTAP